MLWHTVLTQGHWEVVSHQWSLSPRPVLRGQTSNGQKELILWHKWSRLMPTQDQKPAIREKIHSLTLIMFKFISDLAYRIVEPAKMAIDLRRVPAKMCRVGSNVKLNFSTTFRCLPLRKNYVIRRALNSSKRTLRKRENGNVCAAESEVMQSAEN